MHHVKRYDLFSRLLHWTVAIIILHATIIGYFLHFFESNHVTRLLLDFNVSLGFILFPIMIVRFAWRYFRPPVPYDGMISKNEKGVIELLHEVFYLIIFTALISGILMLDEDFYIFWILKFPRLLKYHELNDFFFDVHRYSCIILAVMIMGHVSAVIKRQWFSKQLILRRML